MKNKPANRVFHLIAWTIALLAPLLFGCILWLHHAEGKNGKGADFAYDDRMVLWGCVSRVSHQGAPVLCGAKGEGGSFLPVEAVYTDDMGFSLLVDLTTRVTRRILGREDFFKIVLALNVWLLYALVAAFRRFPLALFLASILVLFPSFYIPKEVIGPDLFSLYGTLSLMTLVVSVSVFHGRSPVSWVSAGLLLGCIYFLRQAIGMILLFTLGVGTIYWILVPASRSFLCCLRKGWKETQADPLQLPLTKGERKSGSSTPLPGEGDNSIPLLNKEGLGEVVGMGQAHEITPTYLRNTTRGQFRRIFYAAGGALVIWISFHGMLAWRDHSIGLRSGENRSAKHHTIFHALFLGIGNMEGNPWGILYSDKFAYDQIMGGDHIKPVQPYPENYLRGVRDRYLGIWKEDGWRLFWWYGRHFVFVVKNTLGYGTFLFGVGYFVFVCGMRVLTPISPNHPLFLSPLASRFDKLRTCPERSRGARGRWWGSGGGSELSPLPRGTTGGRGQGATESGQSSSGGPTSPNPNTIREIDMISVFLEGDAPSSPSGAAATTERRPPLDRGSEREGAVWETCIVCLGAGILAFLIQSTLIDYHPMFSYPTGLLARYFLAFSAVDLFRRLVF